MSSTRKPPVRNNIFRTTEMAATLRVAPQTYSQLATVSGLSKTAVSHWVRSEQALGRLRVAEWREDTRGRRFVAAFGPTTAPFKPADTPRPTPLGSARRTRAYRQRQKEAA